MGETHKITVSSYEDAVTEAKRLRGKLVASKSFTTAIRRGWTDVRDEEHFARLVQAGHNFFVVPVLQTATT